MSYGRPKKVDLSRLSPIEAEYRIEIVFIEIYVEMIEFS